MVDKEIVLQTVKKMYESGIDDSVVEQTLKDIGLNPDEIKQYIAEAKGVPVQAEAQRPEPKPLEKRIAPNPEAEAQEAMHTTTHAALETQTAQNSELLEKLDSLERKLKGISPGSQSQDLVSINQRLSSLEKKVSEIKAEVSAARGIVEKILETDRKVLNRL